MGCNIAMYVCTCVGVSATGTECRMSEIGKGIIVSSEAETIIILWEVFHFHLRCVV